MTIDWRPSWNDESAYPKFGEVTNERWAWEFLRRNFRYQEEWDEFMRTGVSPTRHELWTLFGVGELCDPAENWSEDLGCRLVFQQFIDLEPVTWKHRPGRDGALSMNVEEYTQATQPQAPHEVVLKFDLRFDLEGQWIAALMQLQVMRRLIRKLYERSDHPQADEFSVERTSSAYCLYLRLLDAQVQIGAKNKSALLKAVQPVLAASQDFTADSAVRKLGGNLKQAYAMRDFGYRTLTLVRKEKDFKIPVPKKPKRRSTPKDKKSKRFTTVQEE